MPKNSLMNCKMMKNKLKIFILCLQGIFLCSIAQEIKTWQKNEAFSYTHENWLKVESNQQELSFSSQDYCLTLDPQRNFSTKAFSAGKDKDSLIDLFYLHLRPDEEANISEVYSGNLTTSFHLELLKSELSLVVIQDWASLKIQKSFTFYQGLPFVYVRYKALVKEDFTSQRMTLNIITSSDFDTLAYFADKNTVFRANNGASWFNIAKHSEQRWISYLNSKKKTGLAIIGADPWNWQELPGNLLSSSREKGGFTLELIKWSKRKLKKGETTYIKFFIAALKGDIDKETEKMQKQIIPY